MSKIAQERGYRRHQWRLLTIAAILFFLVTGICFVLVPVQKSKRLEQALIERFDWANEYTPPSNGFIAPERVEGFIRIREAVQANCAILQGILDEIIGMEAMESNPELSPGEKASRGLGGLKTMFSVAPNFLEFMDARNKALLAEEMGLGEYLYIYLAAYGEQLAMVRDSAYAGMDEAYISRRSREEYVRILGNQLAALEAEGQSDSHRELVSDLQGEIEALNNGSHSAPWPNGAAGLTRESLSPFRQRLAALYCAGIVKTELMQKNRGLGFE